MKAISLKLFYFKFICAGVILLLTLTSAAQTVNVMTYNIRYDNPGDGVNQWSNRKTKVFDLLSKYDPDVLGVQEALSHQLKEIVANLDEYQSVGVGREDGKEKGEFSAILFKKDRFELLGFNTFWLSETPEVPGSKNWDAALTRVATWAKLRDKQTKKEFLVINTHFDHVGKEARTKSAALLKAKAREIGKDLPVIITGDFNCLRQDAPYKTMLDPAGLELKDPAPENPPGTFCSFAVKSIECRPIDYIFHSREWKADRYKVIEDHDGANYPSDHLPVMTTLTLPKK
jgi:endonuclease/exonuclease/phosphatase family metal-dependent hydrolase